MKTFLLDIFPKIQRYSERLDNLTLLTNQHWVSIDNILSNKTVYIFRSNNELLISTNGKVEKAKWEYLGNKSLLIDKKADSYLFKHGFFDENILALKVDSSEKYAVFVNENKYNGEINSIERVTEFLNQKYLDPKYIPTIKTEAFNTHINTENNKRNDYDYKTIDKGCSPPYGEFSTDKGTIYIKLNSENPEPAIENQVFQNGSIVENGKYKIGDGKYVVVNEGVIIEIIFGDFRKTDS